MSGAIGANEGAIRSIVGGGINSGNAGVIMLTPAQINNNCPSVKSMLSGVTVAGVLKEALSITGAGYLDIAAISNYAASGRTMRLVITLDGVVVSDQSVTTSATGNIGLVGISGDSYGSTVYLSPRPCRFMRSAKIEFSSSLSETDQMNVYYGYRLTA